MGGVLLEKNTEVPLHHHHDRGRPHPPNEGWTFYKYLPVWVGVLRTRTQSREPASPKWGMELFKVLG